MTLEDAVSIRQENIGVKKQASGVPLDGWDYGYDFDGIGNRKTASVNGQTQTYTANNLNQYTQRTVPGRVDVVGTAEPGSGVTVNGQNASGQGQYFSSSMDVTNTAAPVWQSVTVQSGTQQKQGHVYVPRTPETFTYDFDGNLVTDGRCRDQIRLGWLESVGRNGRVR